MRMRLRMRLRLRMRVRECESAPFSAWSHEGSSTDKSVSDCCGFGASEIERGDIDSVRERGDKVSERDSEIERRHQVR